MGGGEVVKGAEGGKKPAASLELEVLSEYMKIPATRTEVTVMARIKALAQQDEDRRAPVTICAAIDRSGSMKDHLPLLKETLQFMVQQLRPEDKLCLVTFDHEVRTELPMTSMDSAGKLHAEKAIEGIKERGHTNLSGGLLAALEALYRVSTEEASLVESVLLFTDGKANVGIRDQPTLVKATKSMLTQIGRQACVFTFGYGSEHDADLLHAMADAGNGLFYYIDNTDSIPESFCDCLGGLLSVAAQNVHLTFNAAGSVELSKPQTTFRTTEKEPGKAFQVTIPDVYCEEEKCILVKVTVPGDRTVTEAQDLQLVTCHVEYFDVLNSKPSEQSVECSIVRNHRCSNPIHSDCVEEVELHKIRCEVADTLSQANKLAGGGNIRGAKDMLTRVTVRVKGSIVSGNPLAVHLLETLRESMDGLQDEVTYKEHGKAVMQNYAGSHAQQRSCSKPSSDGYGASKMGALKFARKAMAAPEMEFASPYRNKAKMKLLVAHSSQSSQASHSSLASYPDSEPEHKTTPHAAKKK